MIKVLSLFDGISCARVALDRLGIKVDAYYASENDKYSIQIAQKNFPDTVQIGDVTTLDERFDMNEDFANGIDLLIGGSPCQDLSIAKANRKGLDGEKSKLFWEYVRILNNVRPRYFILENVASMSKSSMELISKTLGVYPIMINAALVSAQNRKRLFWVGRRHFDKYVTVPILLPKDKEIMLKDILLDGDTEDLKSLCITGSYAKKNETDYSKKRMGQMIRIGDIGSNAQAHRVYSPEGKSVTLSALGGGQGAKTGLYLVEGAAMRNRGKGKMPEYNKTEKANSITTAQTDSMVSIVQRPRGYNKGGEHTEKSPTLTSQSFEHNNHVKNGKVLRKLHPVECERLQGLPDNYTEGVSNSQRYKMLGNAFNVDVVAHILDIIFPNEKMYIL